MYVWLYFRHVIYYYMSYYRILLLSTKNNTIGNKQNCLLYIMLFLKTSFICDTYYEHILIKYNEHVWWQRIKIHLIDMLGHTDSINNQC